MKSINYNIILKIVNASAQYNSTRFNHISEVDQKEIISDVLDIVISKMDSFDPSKSKLVTWVSTITYHAFCDFLTKRARNKKNCIFFEDIASPERDGTSFDYENYCYRESSSSYLEDMPDEEFYEQEYREELKRKLEEGLNQLNDNDSQILKMCMQGSKNPEIAEALNINVGLVATRKSRAIENLRKKIAA